MALGANLVSSDGAYVYDNGYLSESATYVTSSYAVRPALHLNLAKIAQVLETEKDTSNATAWSAAVEESLTTGEQVTFTLEKDWYAMPDETYTTSFGTGTGFLTGALYVPAGANIKLDLNGHKIDRNLAPVENISNVIQLMGTLEICDSSDNGTGIITGGSRSYGGAITANAGSKLTMNGGNINGNYAPSTPGAIHLNGTFIMNGGKICGNKIGTSHGGAIQASNATIVMTGGEFDGNQAYNSGGAIIMYSNCTMEMSGGTISNHTMLSYGGISCIGGSTFTMTGGTISSNYAARGGGVYVGNKSSFEMTGGTIKDGGASSYGGGVDVENNSTFEFTDGVISGNYAQFGGGIMAYGSGVTMEMSGGTISDNIGNTGSGVYVYCDNTFTLTGGTISGNSGNNTGGGVFVADRALFKMYDGTITGNTNAYGGGVTLYETGTVFEMYGGTISENTATNNGGGVMLYSGSMFIMNGGTISENTASVGKAVHLNSMYAKFTMNGGAITNHEGYQVVNLIGGTFTMNGGEISDNGYSSPYSQSFGCIDLNGFNAKFIMNGGEISNNMGTYGGGAIRIAGGAAVTMNGGTISGNTGKYAGGGVTVDTGTFTMNGGTITGNMVGSSDSGGGVCVGSSGTFNLGGGIISGNITDSRTPSNVYLPSNKTITITGKLSVAGKNATRIGVMLSTNMGKITSGYTSKGNNVSDGSKFFFSDSTYGIRNESGEITLYSSDPTPSTLQWRYSTNGGSAVNLTGSSYSVAYTGASYTLSLSSGSIQYAVDENGNTVSAISKVGKYYFTAANPQSYTNPTYTFEILPGSIEDASISVVSSYVYSGSAITPILRVTLGGKLLTEGVDFTASYSNNVNAGTANIVIVGKGDYKGTAKGTFEIGKRNLNIRWGNTEAEYNGYAKAIRAYAEGLVDGDTVKINLTYQLNGNTVSPVNAGNYTVTASIDSKNYVLATGADVTCGFTIKPRYVAVVWSGNNFVYNGEEQLPEATYTNVFGKTVALEVTVDGSPVDVDEYTATATAPTNSNYVFTNLTFDYNIIKGTATADWGNGNLTYNGTENSPELSVTGANGEDLSDGVTLVYYKNGIELAGAPVNVGEYVVKATLSDDNYELVSEFNFTIGKAEMTLNSVYTDTVFTGLGKTPEITATANDEELEIKVTYSVQGTGVYSEELPVNVGRYIAKIVEVNGNFEEKTLPFEITKATVAVEWSLDEQSVKAVTPSKTTYKWLYDGKAHAPVATAIFEIGEEEVELELTVNGKTAIGTDSVTAALKDTPFNSNITITNTTAYIEIVRTAINSVVWYENGATEALEDGEEPSYKYIEVYGENGPKLRAYGAATLTGVDDGGESLTVTTLIPLKVTYSEFVRNGFWAAREEAYSAEASLSSAYAPYCDMRATDRTIEFYVTDLTTDEEYADVRWVVEVGGEFIDVDDYEFIYNGSAQAPKAIVILDEDKFDEDPTDSTSFAYLPVGGAMTNAGTYYAYILPCRYLIDEDDAELEFTINPLDVTVSWTVGEYTYNGTAQAPVAKVGGTGGLACSVSVAGFVNAGTHTAIAVVDKNFNIVSGETQDFTIEKLTLTADKVEWDCDVDGVWREDGFFAWDYDGELHLPTAAMRVRINGEMVEVALTVMGSASSVGTHYAYAILANTDRNNSNYAFAGARVRFDIVLDTISHIYWSDEDAEGNIYYTYDGNPHLPTAYYMSGTVRVDLNVIGERTEAGTYIAYVTDSYDFAVSTRHTFTILPKPLTVTWSRVETVYTGAEQRPVAKFEDEDGATVYLDSDDYSITGFTGAGIHTAEIFSLNGNYTFVNATCDYTVKAVEITLIWLGNDDGTFEWAYDAEKHVPTVSHNVSGVTVTVIGGESSVGEYTAVAVCDNENYTLKNATQTFEIKPYEITVNWTVGDYTYDGESYFAPTATYVDWNGEEHDLIVKGARVDAGDYTATAILPENCAFKYESGENANTHEFTINRLLLTEISWTGNDDGTFVWEFDGQTHCPVATAGTVIIAITGGAVNAGEYTAKAEPANYKNYAFAEGVEVEKTFTITAKTVDVIWYGENGGEDDDFVWEYDGTLRAPTAKFEGVDGNLVTVPVNGATANSGEHQATAIDVFNNYEFGKLTKTQKFTINGKEVTAVWTAGTDGSYNSDDGVYEYVFNGMTQQPLASADGVQFAYTIKNAAGEVVSAAISAGEYTVTVTATNKNFSVSSASETVNVKIKAMTVTVQWGELTLDYTGTEIVPEAWFIDANGQRVKLEVSGVQTEAGVGYEAEASLMNDTSDYELDGELTKEFSIVKTTAEEVYWDWVTSSWKVIGSETEPEPEEGND